MIGDHRAHLAQRAILQQLPDDVELGQEHRPQCLHEEHPARRGQRGQLRGLCGVQCDRLLDQGVLTRGQRQFGAGIVRVVRGGDVDDVHVRIVDEVPYEPWARSIPCLAANAADRSRSRDPMATTCWRVCRCTDPMNRSAIQPGPMTPQRSGGAPIGSAVRGIGKAVGNVDIDDLLALCGSGDVLPGVTSYRCDVLPGWDVGPSGDQLLGTFRVAWQHAMGRHLDHGTLDQRPPDPAPWVLRIGPVGALRPCGWQSCQFDRDQTVGTWTGTTLPPARIAAMTASATAAATSPSCAVASGAGAPTATASTQACNSIR